MNPQKILVLLPNWIGDAVMATPALSALRKHFGDARIVTVSRSYVSEVMHGLPFIDEVRSFDGLQAGAGIGAFLRDAMAIRGEHFDLAVLMTNSFRTALFVLLGGVRERLGYVREGRGPLLTKRLMPRKTPDGRFEPAPMIDYYLELAAAAGAPSLGRKMTLAVTPEEERDADAVLGRYEVDGSRPVAVLSPGAAFGSAKCWPPENFAAVAEGLLERGYEPLIVTAPGQKELNDRLAADSPHGVKPFWDADLRLGTFKALVKRAAILITNDSGPRHFGAAFGIPTITLFGSSDPLWSDTYYDGETIIQGQAECAPCMLRVCPRDHRCMTSIKAADVMEAVERAMPPGRTPAAIE